MIKVTDKMIYALCDHLPQSQKPKQSIVRIAIQDTIEEANKAIFEDEGEYFDD